MALTLPNMTATYSTAGLFVAYDYALIAFDLATGQHRWRDKDHFGSGAAMHDTSFTPAVAEDMLYTVGQEAGANGEPTPFQVRAVDAATGGQRWDFTGNTHGFAPFPPAFAHASVYFSAADTLYALDAATGATRWSRRSPLGNPLAYGTPGAAARRVYVVDADNMLGALDASTGTLQWAGPENRFLEVDPVECSPVRRRQRLRGGRLEGVRLRRHEGTGPVDGRTEWVLRHPAGRRHVGRDAALRRTRSRQPLLTAAR